MSKFLSKNPYVSLAILGSVWIAYAVYLAYPRVEILLSGERTNAEILEVLPNETSKNFQATDNNTHTVLIDGKKQELVLQDNFPKGEVDILWVPGKHHAVVTENGNYSAIDLMGGWNNFLLIFITSFLVLVGLPYMFRNIRKRTREA